jgi:PhzF family phenazine biosynthesis protein
LVQQCGVGLVTIRRDDDRLAFAAPPLHMRAPGATLLARVARTLDLRPQQIIAARALDNGTPWLGLWLDDPATVLQLTPDFPALAALGQKVGVAAMHRDTDEATLEVRAFAPHLGIDEDPVTGSFNASLAQWLMAEDLAPQRYVVRQGTNLERAGRAYLERDRDGQVWVGGQVVTCIQGDVTL